VVGKGKVLKQVENELQISPLNLYGKPMKQKKQEKYLGDLLHSDGLAASVKATVEARAAALKSGAVEVRAIIEDCRSNCLGGLEVGLEVYELAYIPALLNNAQSRIEIDKTTMDMLEDLQCNFLRILLSTPASTPRAALVWDCGTLRMKF
jgi:hypothetical protein